MSRAGLAGPALQQGAPMSAVTMEDPTPLKQSGAVDP